MMTRIRRRKSHLPCTYFPSWLVQRHNRNTLDNYLRQFYPVPIYLQLFQQTFAIGDHDLVILQQQVLLLLAPQHLFVKFMNISSGWIERGWKKYHFKILGRGQRLISLGGLSRPELLDNIRDTTVQRMRLLLLRRRRR